MTSLEMAKKLKEAGLEWEPKFGDHYIIPAVFEEGLHEVMDTKQIMSYHENPKEWEESIRGFVFTPRLDQLLAEIYETYNFTLHSSGYIVLRKKGSGMVAEHFHSDTLENAAASALLWIYEGRAKA